MMNLFYSKLFLKILRFGCLAWGAPVSLIAMIRQELFEEEKWITRKGLMQAWRDYCFYKMLLQGTK